MKFLLFDSSAISTYIRESSLQSIEYLQGQRFIEHIRGLHSSEIFMDTVVEYYTEGVVFLGKQMESMQIEDAESGYLIFCIDLTQCKILDENDSNLLLLIQKILRTALKIWNRQPFSSSERIYQSKSIVFPFVYPDPRRVVIERSKTVLQLEKRSIDFPLLAYKYCDEDNPQTEENVNTSVLKAAGKIYSSKYFLLQNKLKEAWAPKDVQVDNKPLHLVGSSREVGRDDFIYWSFEQQYHKLTKSQREVVNYSKVNSPLRVEGAAGTGKTMSLIMRAYRLLESHREEGTPFSIVFFSHSQSTFRRNYSAFTNYKNSSGYLREGSLQHIEFITLSDYCASFSGISLSSMLEKDAADAKTYQLLLIEKVVSSKSASNKIRTYYPLISSKMKESFDAKVTAPNALYSMLQHEFSVQIKGRTDSTIDKYYEISPIPNGLPCETKKDKELIFSLFSDYQHELQSMGSFDMDDVILEAIARMNAPIWRRERASNGYDYIFVDEMHLFNINEQSVFHYLTKHLDQKDIPICFALDYSQAIGDRGNVRTDYIENAFGTTEGKKYHTVFRCSPQITDFCTAVAASGVLMFHENFSNPYLNTQSSFSHDEEKKSKVPELYQYDSDEQMVASLNRHISDIMKELQCKQEDIVIIGFDEKFYTADGIEQICKRTGRHFISLASVQKTDKRNVQDGCIVASPYDINGMEFQSVILLGVDEGRLPQTTGTSDISQHYIKYSAYNLLYLSASRAKYRLLILCNRLKGRSSCLNHALEENYLHEIKT